MAQQFVGPGAKLGKISLYGLIIGISMCFGGFFFEGALGYYIVSLSVLGLSILCLILSFVIAHSAAKGNAELDALDAKRRKREAARAQEKAT